MINRILILLLIALLAATLLVGCEGNPTTSSKSKLQISVGIAPIKTFVDRIGGEHVSVSFMLNAGDSPATYDPKPQQLVELKQAVAYFSVGVPFEHAWMERFRSTNSNMEVIDLTQNITLAPILDHAHEDADESNENEILDPHIWLSPNLVKIQAQHIYESLIKFDPAHQIEYEENLNNFLQEIDELDVEIRGILTNTTYREFVVFHPSWGYFARDYDLEMISIEAGGTEPSPPEFEKIIEEIREVDAKIIISQPELGARSAKNIADQVGAKLLSISPLDAEWKKSLLKLAQAIAER
jgi:zinc transport system substrate-binding protein